MHGTIPPIGQKARSRLAALLVIPFISGVALYFVAAEAREENNLVKHSLVVQLSLERLLSDMEAAETSERGYLLTSEERYLEPYHNALARAHQELVNIRELTADNPFQQRVLAELQTAMNRRVDRLEETIVLHRGSSLTPAVQAARIDEGRGIMESLQTQVEDLRREENRLLQQRETAVSDATVRFVWCSALGYLLIILVVGSLYRGVQRYSRQVVEAEQKLSKWNAELEQRIDERTRSLKEAETALRRSEHELRELAGSLLSAQEDERRRIARDLHDDVTQRLALLSIEMGKLAAETGLADTAGRLRSFQSQVLRISSEVRRVSHGLHPSVIEDFGLSTALEEFCDEFAKAQGIRVQFEGPVDDAGLSAEAAACLYRIAQESMQNAAKHGRASEVRVGLANTGQSLVLVVKDNGAGFSAERDRGATGLGVISMKERIRLVNGALRIDSLPGTGTEITASVPLSGAGNETASNPLGRRSFPAT